MYAAGWFYPLQRTRHRSSFQHVTQHELHSHISRYLAVQIATRKRTTVVAVDYTVRIEHGNDFKHEVIPKDLGVQAWPNEVVDDALHHPTGIRFAWVHSRRYDYALSQLRVTSEAV